MAVGRSLLSESWILCRWLILKAVAEISSVAFGRTPAANLRVISFGNWIFKRAYPRALFHDYESYVRSYGASLSEYDQLIPRAEWLDDRVVLDLGAGLGQYSSLLAKSGARQVVGVEIQSDKVKWARERYSNAEGLEFICAPASELANTGTSYDAVFSHTVFEHLDDVPASLTAVNRVLKPEGLVVLSFNFIHHRGGHHLFPYIHFPWPLGIVDEGTLCRYWSDRLAEDQAQGHMGFFPKGCRLETLSDGSEIHLNRLNFEQFEDMVAAAGFDIATKRSSEQLGRAFPWLLKSRFRFHLSGTIYYVLRKRIPACAA